MGSFISKQYFYSFSDKVYTISISVFLKDIPTYMTVVKTLFACWRVQLLILLVVRDRYFYDFEMFY